jgi:hypothetical protein
LTSAGGGVYKKGDILFRVQWSGLTYNLSQEDLLEGGSENEKKCI